MNVLKYLKAYVGFALAVGTWYVASYPAGADAHWVALGIAALTGLGVAVTTNQQNEVDTVLDHAFPDPAVRGNTDPPNA